MSRPERVVCTAIALALAIGVPGCASTKGPGSKDPWESFNRGSYKFNDTVDKAVLKPVAKAYRVVLPQFVRVGVTNFFSNIDDLRVIANQLLQAKFRRAGEDTGRFIINTTAGVLGFIDVATIWGVPKHNEDFGQTLGYWGVGTGPYVVLPFFGPSTVRDAAGLFTLDSTLSYWPYVDNMAARNSAYAIDTVNTRARLLDSEKILEEAALDPYAFLRDAYLQRRERLVYDGKPPKQELEEDMGPEDSDSPGANTPPGGEPLRR